MPSVLPRFRGGHDRGGRRPPRHSPGRRAGAFCMRIAAAFG